jgi:GDP-D-mannose dehydratase
MFYRYSALRYVGISRCVYVVSVSSPNLIFHLVSNAHLVCSYEQELQYVRGMNLNTVRLEGSSRTIHSSTAQMSWCALPLGR